MGSIDFHAHLAQGPEALAKLLHTMTSLEIERTVVVPGGTVSPYELARRIAAGGEHDVAVDNAAMLAQCRASDGRLLPFFFGNPHRGSAEYWSHGHAYFGLKLGPAVHGVPLLDPRHEGLLDAARAHGHPVYLHCLARDGFRVEDLVLLARRRREQTFILGHAGIGQLDLGAVEAVEGEENVMFETSGGMSFVVKEAISRLGAARVIFGSEYPLQDPRVELTKARTLGLSDADLERYLRGNAECLLLRGGGDA